MFGYNGLAFSFSTAFDTFSIQYLLTFLCLTAIFQKMDTSMGLSSIASLSLGLSMSMTGTPGGVMMMRNLGVNTGPLKGGGPLHRLGGGPLHRSNNSLSRSPRNPRSPALSKLAERTAESVQPSTASSRENVDRLNEDGEVPRTKESLEDQTLAEEVPQSKRPGSPGSQLLVDGVRQKVSVDVEPTPADVRLPPSTVSDSIILVVPDLVTTTAKVTPAPPPRTSSFAGASDGPVAPPINCILLSTDDAEPTDSTSQPTIGISLDSSDDDEDEDAPPTSSSSAESISHILSSTQLSVDPHSYYIHNGPVNKGQQSALSDKFTILHVGSVKYNLDLH